MPPRRRMDYTHAYERCDTLYNYRQSSFFSQMYGLLVNKIYILKMRLWHFLKKQKYSIKNSHDNSTNV